jgi:hypothetical protein
MRRSDIIFASLLAICMTSFAQEEGELVSIRITRGSMEQFVSQIEEQIPLKVFYRPEWFEGYSVTYSADSVAVEDAFDVVLRGTGLYFSLIDSSRLVILPDGRLNPELPVMHSETGVYRDESEGRDYLGVRADQYLSGTRPEQISRTIVVGDRRSTSRTIARVKGRLLNMDNGEPVAGATMVELGSGKGSVSDQNGNVSMALLPGKHAMRFSFIGLEPIDVTLEVISDGDFQLEMRPAVIALDEVQIMGEQYRDINTTDIGVERFSMNSLKQVPVFMGERDVIKISKLLPGITSAGEASVGVNVRGGNVDQNIFYINRLPVYNTSHLFGFFSAFNSDMIRDFSIYKGNVPVNYGGRLSSVFNILTRKGNNKAFTAHAGISPVSAQATFEGPIRKEHSSFLISGRSSYSDWILNRMEDPLIRDSDAFFYDFAGS